MNDYIKKLLKEKNDFLNELGERESSLYSLRGEEDGDQSFEKENAMQRTGWRVIFIDV